MYVRGFDPKSGKIEDEPEKDAETVLTVRLTIASDLEPSWSLVSERAEAQGQMRNLSWGDRVPAGADSDRRDGRLSSGLAARLSVEPCF